MNVDEKLALWFEVVKKDLEWLEDYVSKEDTSDYIKRKVIATLEDVHRELEA